MWEKKTQITLATNIFLALGTDETTCQCGYFFTTIIAILVTVVVKNVSTQAKQLGNSSFIPIITG